MLPAAAKGEEGQNANDASSPSFLSKVASTFSLRKRRAVTRQNGGKGLNSKVMKIKRQ